MSIDYLGTIESPFMEAVEVWLAVSAVVPVFITKGYLPNSGATGKVGLMLSASILTYYSAAKGLKNRIKPKFVIYSEINVIE